MFLATGCAEGLTPLDALTSAIKQCEKQLGRKTPRACLVFTSLMDADFPLLLDTLFHRFGDIELMGCTTDGEIAPQSGPVEMTVALAVFASDTVDIVTGIGHGMSVDPVAAVTRARDQALGKTRQKPALCIAIPDGLTTMGVPLDQVMTEVFADLNIPVVGGTAGDHWQLTGTYQFHGREVVQDGVVVMMICGAVDLAVSAGSGWSPLGRKFSFAGAKKNVLYRIGDMTALDFLKHYLGDNVKEYLDFTLALFDPGADTFCLRSPAGINTDDNSVYFVGNFPETGEISFTEAIRDNMIDESGRAFRDALSAYPGDRPDVVLVFACCSRRHILGTRIHEDVKLPAGSNPMGQVFGFYCYGELAPATGQPGIQFHNGSLIVVALGEKRGDNGLGV